MFYTIYKTTNLTDGKYYIGKHKTKNLDDNYLGSGKILKRAINKHGINNFTKEYLFIFDNEEDMDAKEKELVSEEFIKEDTNYNLKIGGEGGWDYINNHPTLNPSSKGGKATAEMFKKNKERFLLYRQSQSAHRKNNNEYILYMKKAREALDKKYPNGTFYNKEHTTATKLKMSKSNTHQKGSNNSQYGMMWIYSLEEKISKRIKKDEIIPEGWYKGRKMSF